MTSLSGTPVSRDGRDPILSSVIEMAKLDQASSKRGRDTDTGAFDQC